MKGEIGKIIEFRSKWDFKQISYCYYGKIIEKGEPDFTEKELDEFLESLNTKQFQEIQNFFETMPKLKHEVKFKNPKTKKNNKVTLEGLNSFFV